jgi:hypothetical protein
MRRRERTFMEWGGKVDEEMKGEVGLRVYK